MIYTISTDKQKLDVRLIHEFLSEQSYWAKGIGRDIVEKSIENSFCFGVFADDYQIGFARVISDHTTFAYLADVFILPEYRNLGLSKKLVKEIMEHPELQNLRRWMLATADAHTLYAQFGFTALASPEKMMEIVKKNMYVN